MKTKTHLHNVDDYYYNVDVDGGGDADGEDDADDGDDDGGWRCDEGGYEDCGGDGGEDEDDDDDKWHLTAGAHLFFVEVMVKIIPQSPSPRSNCLKSTSLFSCLTLFWHHNPHSTLSIKFHLAETREIFLLRYRVFFLTGPPPQKSSVQRS